MFQTFIITSVLVTIAILALGVNIFFRKQKFPETEVGKNKRMRSLGISCVKCDEMKKFREAQKFKNLRIDIKKLSM